MSISLQNFGLSDKEAKVYQTLLELGPQTVISVTKQAGVNRTTGYFVLESLQQKGLVGLTQKRKRVLYSANDPEIISHYVAKQTKEWQERLSQINKIIPELRAIYQKPTSKPTVRYYEGIDGLKNIYEDSLLCKEKHIRSYTSTEKLKDIMGDYAEQYFIRRAQNNIFIRSIATAEPYGFHLKKVQKKFLREVRLMPREKYAITPEIYIYDNKVSYIDLAEKFGVVTESDEIAKAEKKIYELAWEAAKKYDGEEEKKLKQKNTA
ncbi:MAG: helix-turn-helix domain-containing protein [bacterium]